MAEIASAIQDVSLAALNSRPDRLPDLPEMTLKSTIAFLIGLCATIPTFASEQAQEKFFETKIRPLLAEHCFSCHGPKKQESGVRLDRRAFVFGKSDVGTLVTPQKPDESRIWAVVQYDDFDVQMPPKGKLKEADLQLLKTWIEQGAYWPDDGAAPAVAANGLPLKADGTIDFAKAANQHWAYQPVKRPAVPTGSADGKYQSPIDHFIAQKLNHAGLTFSAPAERRTLIRRLTINLTGLPPTYDQVQEFLNDKRPDAVERLIDRLLASPLYGQRWGRFWLDIARYADTKGYVFTENRYYPYSYTYRDYVVDSLNKDTPYDRFVTEQLAADKLDLPENDPRLAALGFLTVGPRFLNREPDIIDDRIDVVTRGLMGMTMACARCHDHKYDPLPAADYYSLYGVFNSCYEPDLLPLIGQPDESDPEYQAFAKELAKRQAALDDYVTKSHNELLKLLTANVVDFIPQAAQKLDLISKDAKLETPHGEQRARLVSHWSNFIKQHANRNHPVFLPWKKLMESTDEQLASQTDEERAKLLAGEKISAPVRQALLDAKPKSRLDVATVYAKLFSEIIEEWKAAQAQKPPLPALAAADHDQIRQVLFGQGSISDVPVSQNSPLFERDHRNKVRELERKIGELRATSPAAPPRAMVLIDKDRPVNPRIFLRGDPRRRGPEVTRHVPRILTPQQEQVFENSSGRLELAKAITAEDNPLTARVIVNRVWTHHFGKGIVGTASDFGTRSDAPTHPELLDYLAWTFMHEDHWSLKALHRRILSSRAYQQASVNRPDARKVDPENRLLWRQNRQRLDFEAMRDSLLAISGQLDPQLKGRPVEMDKVVPVYRRTVYGLIDRNNLPGLLRTFDFPSPDYTSPGRPLTTVPQQALYAMNSAFVQTASRKLAEDVRQESSETQQQVNALVEQVYQRQPTAAERDMLTRYLESHPLDQLSQALLMTNEFLFVD